MKKFDPFEYQNAFYEYKLDIHENEINQIMILVKNNKIKSEQKTTYEYLNVLNFPILKNLKDQVINILNKHKLLLTNNWAQLYNNSDKHGVHIHPNSNYSGIIYLDPIKASSTTFYDKNFKPYYHKFNKGNLLLFPSHIPHEVEALKVDEKRLVISFNTMMNTM